MRNLITYLLVLLMVATSSCKKKQTSIPTTQPTQRAVVPQEIIGQRVFEGWHYITPPNQTSPDDSVWKDNIVVNFVKIDDTTLAINFSAVYGNAADTFLTARNQTGSSDSLEFYGVRHTLDWGYLGKLYFQKSNAKVNYFFHQRFTSKHSKQHDYYILKEK
jgi:hypothetical protein